MSALRNVREPTTAPIFDSELEEEIKYILRECGTHTATISIRRQSGDGLPEHQVKTIVTSGDPISQLVTPGGEERFHIASITKVLVATAVIIAVEKRPTEDESNKFLQRFRDTQDKSFTRVYNEYKLARINALPGDPTVYDFLVHRKGFPSSNHRLLSPVGHPLMGLSDVWDELLSRIAGENTETGTLDPWAGYSNVNYAAVAMAIEAMWGRTLESFMSEILFKPLGMQSTSIGVPDNGSTENKGWVVDSSGEPREIQRPLYRADGAEGAAFGVYSTAHDLDTFFKFIIDTFHRQEIIPGFDLSNLAKVLRMTYTRGESLHFTPLGLYTSLSTSVIGALSTNRAQFPENHFSKFNVFPDQGEDNISVYYMAGSAIACSCATALHVGEKNSFAVVVLTNTSGPVDAADHVLKLILQRLASRTGKRKSSSRLIKPVSIRDMVIQNRIESLRKWKEVEQKWVQDLERAPVISKRIEGVFKGENFGQRLVVTKKINGKIYIAVDGPVLLPHSTEFELLWIDGSSVRMNIPPHLSVDWFGEGDWSNAVFRVEDEDQIVVALVRTTSLGEDRFLRTS